jgi:hypothetical protein
MYMTASSAESLISSCARFRLADCHLVLGFLLKNILELLLQLLEHPQLVLDFG